MKDYTGCQVLPFAKLDCVPKPSLLHFYLTKYYFLSCTQAYNQLTATDARSQAVTEMTLSSVIFQRLFFQRGMISLTTASSLLHCAMTPLSLETVATRYSQQTRPLVLAMLSMFINLSSSRRPWSPSGTWFVGSPPRWRWC